MTCLLQCRKTKSPPSTRQRTSTTKTIQYLTMPLTREQCTTKTIQYLTMPLTREQGTTNTSQCLSPESNTTKTIQYLTMPLNREQCTTKTIQHNTMPVIPPFLPPSVPRPRHFSGAGRTIRREAGGAATALYYLSLRTQATPTTQRNSNGLQLFISSLRRCLSNCQGPNEHQSNYDQRLTTQAFTNPTYNRSEN